MSKARNGRIKRGLLVILFVATVAGGAVLGIIGARTYVPQTVSAEARLVVGDQTLSAQAVPGYAEGTKQLAVTYSRLVTSDEVRQTVKGTVRSVSATPIADSAIIRVVAEADNAKDSVAGSRAAAERLIKISDEARSSRSPAKAIAQYRTAYAALQKANKQLGDARAVGRLAAIDAAGRAVAEAKLKTDAYGRIYQEQLSGSQTGSGQIVLISGPTVVAEQIPRIPVLGGLAGAFGVTAVWGVFLIVARTRRDQVPEPEPTTVPAPSQLPQQTTAPETAVAHNPENRRPAKGLRKPFLAARR